jgi:hypothetical protein
MSDIQPQVTGGGWISGPSVDRSSGDLPDILPVVPKRPTELSDRQRALYWLTLAEAASMDERLMLVSVLARLIRATPLDAATVREALLGGVT